MDLTISTVDCSSHPAQALIAHYKDTSLLEKGISEHDEQLAGFIFMCNGRSKPQCYQYRVFGLPRGRLELVKKIKPGMKLFLYDFELKLLYGIYEATTVGSLNLEQAAFNGRFPAQVGFKIYKDCMPLHESSFRHAVERNHQNSYKFNQELNKQQVEHLLSMFRPLTVQAHSASLPMLHQDVQNQSSLPFFKDSCPQVLHSQHVQQTGSWQHDCYRAQLNMGQVDPMMEPQLHLNLVNPIVTGMKHSYVPPASEQPYYTLEAASSLQQQHVGSTTNIGHSHQTMRTQVLLTENEQYYMSEVQQPYETMGVTQQVVTRNLCQLPLQREEHTVQRQDGFFQYYNYYPLSEALI